MIINGVITTDAISADHPVTVYVRLEDTARADAAARVVAEQKLRLATLESTHALAFELGVEELDARGQYSIFVHIDVDNDGRVSAGDYISTESYPVALFQSRTRQTIRLHRVE